MAVSYTQRIRMAEDALVEAIRQRDTLYPGSPEWEAAQDKVVEWQTAIRDLRSEAADGG